MRGEIMPKKNKKSTETRARIWSFIAYHDSAPKDWENILTTQFNLKWARSPLHDSDLNADETQKKPHWHVVLVFDGVKSYRQVLSIAKSIKATNPQIVHNLQGLMRYFLHLDNPEKAQYEFKDILSVGINAELEIYGENEVRKRVVGEMVKFCEDNDIREFCDLMNYALESESSWFEALSLNSAMVMNNYLKSRRHKLQND